MPRETEKHSLMMIGEKQIGGQRPGGRNQDGSGTAKSEEHFLVSGFRTHVVATAVCATGRYTHSVSHAHFSDTFSLCGVQTSRTRMAQGVCSAHVKSPHLTISLPMFHPHGHLDTSFLSAPSLPNCSRSKSACQAHFGMSAEESGYLADPTHSASYEPKELDKITSADGDTTPINDPNYDNISDFSKITRENTGLFSVSTMLEESVSHVSHGESKDIIHRETVARQRKKEREEREGSVISVAESMSKKSRRNSFKSHSLQTHREFYSDERDLREDLERRAQQAVLGENSAQRKFFLTEYDLEIQNLERRNSEYALIESRRELESQRRQLLEANQSADQAQRETKHLCSELDEEPSAPGMQRKTLTRN